MNYLRLAIALYALLYVGIGVFLLQHSNNIFSWYLIIYFFINAGVIIAGVFFERSRYKTKHTAKSGWVRTKERFVDHQSGKTVEVYFHPQTGERKYQEVE